VKGQWGNGLRGLRTSERLMGDILERQFLAGFHRNFVRREEREETQPLTEDNKLDMMNMYARGLEQGLNTRGRLLGGR
jgi:hypothetical protein